jgi:hypothetical protein
MGDEITWGDPKSPECRDLLDLAYEVRGKKFGPGNYLFHWRNGQYCLAAADGDWKRLATVAAETAAAKGTKQLTHHEKKVRKAVGIAMGEEWTQYDHFGIIVMLGLQAWAGKKFPAKAMVALKEMLLNECAGRGGAFVNDFAFANDNYPFMALTIEILGGELLGREDVAEHGLIKLTQYSQRMSKNGITCEFCSPNYAPWHIVPLSMVAAMSKNAEARQRAQAWCDFIWFELSQRWHNGLCQMTGPNSRAYTEEIYGGWSYIHALLHRLVGAPLGLDYKLAYETGHNEDFYTASYFAFCPVYCPQWVRNLLLRRPQDDCVEAVTQTGPSWDGSISIFPSTITTYSLSRPNLSMASSSRFWCWGWQGNAAIAYWNLISPPSSLADQRVAYSRMILDDHGPMRENVYITNFEGDAKPAGSRLTFMDDGYCCAAQKENAILVASRPNWAHRRRHAIRHSLLISDFADKQLDVFVDGKPVELPFRSKKAKVVVVQDEAVVTGLRALEVSDLGRPFCLGIAREDRHLWISFWNYQGPVRDFTADQFLATRNGFAWIVEDAGKTTPEKLFHRMNKAKIADDVKGVYRYVSYDDGTVQLAMKLHRDCPDPHLMEVDGRPYQCPIFSSPYVQGGFDRDLVVGEARLTANRHPLFLRGDPQGNEYAVYNFAGQPCDWRLRIGKKVLDCHQASFGYVRFVRAGSNWKKVVAD